jgi:hypothetical protein
MKHLTLLAVLFCACGITQIADVEGYCARCVQANENNKRNINEHFYYEDYVEAQQQR